VGADLEAKRLLVTDTAPLRVPLTGVLGKDGTLPVIVQKREALQ